MNSPASPDAAKQILVVDDEKLMRDILAHTLSFDGFDVSTAANGNDALDLMRNNHFDLVITDMIMPGKEGIETIMELRALAPDVKIIAMSGGQSGGTGDFLPLAKTLGASAVFRKPFERETFITTVRAMLESGKQQVIC